MDLPKLDRKQLVGADQKGHELTWLEYELTPDSPQLTL